MANQAPLYRRIHLTKEAQQKTSLTQMQFLTSIDMHHP